MAWWYVHCIKEVANTMTALDKGELTLIVYIYHVRKKSTIRTIGHMARNRESATDRQQNAGAVARGPKIIDLCSPKNII